MASSIPRFLLPWASSVSRRSLCLDRVSIPLSSSLPRSRRYASSAASSSRAKLLEKPTRYNPPSHPRRKQDDIPKNFGPGITDEQRAKRYPHMFPPQGTFMHWFLTNRGIHTWITLVRDKTMTETRDPFESYGNGTPVLSIR